MKLSRPTLSIVFIFALVFSFGAPEVTAEDQVFGLSDTFWQQNCEPSADQIAVFMDKDFSGECRTYIVGSSPRPFYKKWDNSISSIKIGSKMRVWVCDDYNFEGTCEMISRNDSSLSDNKVGDNAISSFNVQVKR